MGSLAISIAGGSLTRKAFTSSVMSVMRISCMIALILTDASFLTVAMGFTGIPRAIAAWIGVHGIQLWQVIAVFTLLFFILGMFLDGISMIVLIASVILPSVKAVGIDHL